MIDERLSRLLQTLVEEYIRTGQPVSSGTLLERSGLDISSATIRNDVAKLESYGFVAQPHVSAGRVPTHAGYRFYVDHCSPTRLRAATRSRIESFFSTMTDELSRLLEETSGLLSDLSHYPAVVIGPGFGTETVRGFHLVKVGSEAVMAITIGRSGRVAREIVPLDRPLSDKELDEVESIVETAAQGRTVVEAVDVVASLASDLPERTIEIAKQVAAVVGGMSESTKELYIGGTSQLAELWEDLAQVHSVLELLETDGLRTLMAGGDGTSVKIGREIDEGSDFSVVSTSFMVGDATGRVGVLGPTRMDYRRSITLVEEVGEGLEDRLGG
jgi:heat-inducible transcriptional repressor